MVEYLEVLVPFHIALSLEEVRAQSTTRIQTWCTIFLTKLTTADIYT